MALPWIRNQLNKVFSISSHIGKKREKSPCPPPNNGVAVVVTILGIICVKPLLVLGGTDQIGISQNALHIGHFETKIGGLPFIPM